MCSVINYEEGGEHSLDQGDSEGEAMLQEIGTGKTPYVGQRDTRESSLNFHHMVNRRPYTTIKQPYILHNERRCTNRITAMETSFEYGSRVGIWRLLNLFEKHSMRVTMYAVGLALENNPPATKAMLDGGHEIASHCWRWFNL